MTRETTWVDLIRAAQKRDKSFKIYWLLQSPTYTPEWWYWWDFIRGNLN